MRKTDSNDTQLDIIDLVIDRKPASFLWLFSYGLLVVVMIIMAGHSFINDNPQRIVNGYDSFGNICGFIENSKWDGIDESGKNTEDLKYVFSFDSEHWTSLKLCVRECPNEDIYTVKGLQEYTKTHNISYCLNYNVTLIDGNGNNSDPAIFSAWGPCPKLPLIFGNGTPIMNRCVPSGGELIESFDLLEEAGMAVYATWSLISFIVILSIVFSIIMLRYLPNIGSHLSCIFAILTSIASLGLLWYTFYDIKQNTSVEKFKVPGVWKNEIMVLIIAITFTVLAIILFVKTHLKRTNFGELAKVFDEAKECISDVPGLRFLIFHGLLSLLILMLIWTVVETNLATALYPIYDNVTDTIQFEAVSWRSLRLYFFIVAFIWTVEFIFAVQKLTLDESVANWYFRKDASDSDESTNPLQCLSSAAKSSFHEIPRLLICKKKLLRAASAASVGTNSESVSAINENIKFIILTAEVTIMAVCGSISLLILKSQDDVNFYIVPVILISLFTFLVATTVLSVYTTVINTLLVCVYGDCTQSGDFLNSNRPSQLNLGNDEILTGQTLTVNIPSQVD